MENSQYLKCLIKYLLAEYEQAVNHDTAFKLRSLFKHEQLFRALVNVRPPKPIEPSFLEIQDKYLQGLLQERGTVTIEFLTPHENGLHLWQGDITRLAIDAIVNAANSQLLGCFAPCHNCIDNIIHTLAGVQLRLECAEIMINQGYDEPTGQAKITSAYNLPAKHIIHTVGPIVSGKLTNLHEELLASVYHSCLRCANDNQLNSIAFCCVSTGEYRFHPERAAEIAILSVKQFLSESNAKLSVIFNVFKDSDHKIYKKLLGADC